MQEIKYEVSRTGISPQDTQNGGVQGDHRVAALVFKMDEGLWGELGNGLPDGHTVCYRVEVTDGSGGFYASELLTPDGTSRTVTFPIPREISRAGGAAQFFLIVSDVDEDSRESRTLYSFPARVRFQASAGGTGAALAYYGEVGGALQCMIKALETFQKAFPIGTEQIADKAVTTEKLADGAVNTVKIADGAIPTPKLAYGAVTKQKIAAGAIGPEHLSEDIFWNYRTADFNDLTDYGLYVVRAKNNAPPSGASTYALLVISSGNTMQIAIPNGEKRIYIRSYHSDPMSGNMVWDEWADTGEVKNDSITAEMLQKGAVTSAKLADGSLTTEKYGFKSIKGDHIKDYAVGWGHLQNNAVTAEKLQSNAVTAEKLADGAVTAEKLADGVLPKNPVTAAEELGEGKILVGVGERKAAAGDYTVDAVVPEEGFVRFTMPGGGFIKLPNLGADGACSLTLEARCVSGSPGQIGPNVEPYYWDGASGYLDLPANGEWKPAALSNIDNGSLFNLGITCYKAGTYDIRNISLTDAAGSDIIDHAAFRAQGEYHPVVEDTPENHQLPTLQKVRELTGPIDTRLTAAKTELDQTRSLLADMVTICGVRFEGGDNSGPAVTRLYDAAGKTAGVGTDTRAAVNDFDHIYPWSARRRCCGSFDESGRFTVNAYAGDPGFTTDGSAGEVWVEHSLFYYKHTYDGGAEEILISSFPLTGFSPAPIFLKPDGSLLQKAYTAAYPMATVDGKATSRAGVFSDAYSLNTAMTAARSLGEHYAVSTTAEWYTECLYMWVEFATRNLQSVMAGATSLPFAAADTAALAETDTNRVIVTNAVANTFVIGQTIGIGTAPGGTQVASNRIVTAIETYDADHKALIFDGPAVDIAAGNTVWSAAWVNGSCDGVLSSSGSPVSNAGGKYNCVYRGKESPYGNAFEWISDLLFKREGAGTADDPHSYAAYYLPDPDKYAAGQITTDYVKLNFKLPDADGYVKKLGLDARYPHTRIPTETGAAASAYYSDYYYKPAAPVCAASVGGSWNGGALAGPCYWNCNASPSDASPHRRARLSFHRS